MLRAKKHPIQNEGGKILPGYRMVLKNRLRAELNMLNRQLLKSRDGANLILERPRVDTAVSRSELVADIVRMRLDMKAHLQIRPGRDVAFIHGADSGGMGTGHRCAVHVRI